MKLALVHMRHARTGGTERFLDHLAKRLAERGHDVTILCRSHEQAPDPRVRFRTLRPLSVGAAWRIKSFAQAVASHVARADYELVFALGRTDAHDLIRLGGGCHASFLERRSGGADARLRPKDRAILAIEERALRPDATRRVITNSAMVRDDVVRRFAFPVERIEVVYNGVDLERFHPRRHAEAGRALRASLGWSADEEVVLFLGTGYERKGLDVLLAACRPLFAQRARARLMVVGYDSARGRYEALAERLGLAERVRFLGGRRDAEVCFAAADLYALPTRYDPFANSTLEALASGLPTVTSAANGGGELITDGVEGRVLDEVEPEALAAALDAFVDVEPRRAAAAAARTLAEQHGIETKLARVEELLELTRAERALQSPR